MTTILFLSVLLSTNYSACYFFCLYAQPLPNQTGYLSDRYTDALDRFILLTKGGEWKKLFSGTSVRGGFINIACHPQDSVRDFCAFFAAFQTDKEMGSEFKRFSSGSLSREELIIMNKCHPSNEGGGESGSTHEIQHHPQFKTQDYGLPYSISQPCIILIIHTIDKYIQHSTGQFT